MNQTNSGSAQRATIADVARRAGVSIATVSRVLSKSAPVADDTATRVLTAISELNYRPHMAARGLASRRTNTLGLALPEISGDFFAPLLRGIEGVAREAGLNLLISTGHGSGGVSLDPGAPSPLGEHNTDGLLVFSDSLTDAEIRYLHSLSFPMVLLHRTPPDAVEVPCVTFENKSGTRRAIDHLIEAHGCRRIAFLRGPHGHEDSYWREMGYREALAAHYLPFDPALVGTGEFDEDQAHLQMEQWLAEGLQVDAIFAGDDDSALGVMLALQQAGRRIPEDVAVVGFDDVSLSRHLNPPLTTVHAPIETAGREAAQRLIRLVRNETVEPLVLLPTELVIRQSCGCGRKEAHGETP